MGNRGDKKMNSTTIDCMKCKGSGNILKKKDAPYHKNINCPHCEAYGYVHPPSGKHRRLLPGEIFFFLATSDHEPSEEENKKDFIELNGAGYLVINNAECCDPEYDRASNFFFTKDEARTALAKIRKIIKDAR